MPARGARRLRDLVARGDGCANSRARRRRPLKSGAVGSSVDQDERGGRACFTVLGDPVEAAFCADDQNRAASSLLDTVTVAYQQVGEFSPIVPRSDRQPAQHGR